MKNLVKKTYRSLTNSSTPVVIPAGVKEIKIRALRTTEPLGGVSGATYILDADGQAWSLGATSLGVLGNGQPSTAGGGVSLPVAVVGGFRFIGVPSGVTANGTGMTKGGKLLRWGNGSYIGDGSTTGAFSSPIAVIPGGTPPYVMVKGGNWGSIALAADGTAWCWGANGNGECGIGNTTTPQYTPAAVVGGNVFVAVAAGANHAVGLKSDGTAWAWGANTDGSNGDGTVTAKSSPIAVLGGHSFIAIHAANNTSVGLKANGSIWTWGGSVKGELGDGTNVAKSSPVAVLGGHSFVAVHGASNSGGYFIALKADGSVYTWGSNGTGTLGDGTVAAKSSPVAVLGGNVFTFISAGGGRCLGVTKDGKIMGWGSDFSGELGQNAVGSKSSPVAVLGGLSAMANQIETAQRSLAVTPGASPSLAFLSGNVIFNGEVIGFGNIAEIEYFA